MIYITKRFNMFNSKYEYVEIKRISTRDFRLITENERVEYVDEYNGTDKTDRVILMRDNNIYLIDFNSI